MSAGSRFTLKLVLPLLVGLVLAEVGLRVFVSQDSRWNMRMGVNKQFDPVMHFRLKPDYEYAGGIRTNEYGYLAPRGLQREKPPDELRIVYLGDSATHMPVQSNYPMQVEQILEARGIPVQTVNAAVPGFASHNALALFEHELSRFDADFFFVYVGWNDLGQFGPEGLPYKKQEGGYEISPVQRVLAGLHLPRLVYAVLNHMRRSQPTLDAPLGPEDASLYESYVPRHFEENLGRILRAARERYPHVFVMTLATITNDDPTESELARAHFPVGMDKNMRKLDRLVGSYNAVVRRVAEQEDVPLVDFYAAFDSHEARLEFTDSAHVTPAGARRMAEAVVAAVEATGASLPRRDVAAP